MAPEERAEQIVTTEPGMDAIRHGDLIQLERLIAAAIRAAVLEEREACARAVEALIDPGDNPHDRQQLLDAAQAIRKRPNP
jgi:hypothetical protein